MEDYPAPYVAVARPLVVLSGLQDEDSSKSLPNPLNNGPATPPGPPISSARAKEVQDAFVSFDYEQSAKSQDTPQRYAQQGKFRFRVAGRRYVFPCRKASPIPSQMTADLSTVGSNQSHVLHSPLSPLSLGSPINPDGSFTSLWMLKYRDALPAVFMSFFSLAQDKNAGASGDVELKTTINTIKTALGDCNYKGKLVIVMLGEHNAGEGGIEDRLSSIRRACKLENKSTFFYLPDASTGGDLELFVDFVLHTVRPFCVEFYKTLHKHAKKKKDKRSSTPSTPTTENVPQHLSNAGWNARYAFKMGFFSEVRQELDVASRAYEEALTLLLGSGGAIESISNWSPRWNEMRMFADIIAIRRIRCLLADGAPSAAVSFWTAYHDHTQNLANTIGRGTTTYAWSAWEARQAKVMGQLVQESFALAVDLNARKMLEPVGSARRLAFASSEKPATLERSNPWARNLHHAGYWFSLSAAHQQARSILAGEIPDEDKRPPDQSPAASVARVHREYDTYLCPEPHVEGNGFDHSTLIVETLQLAQDTFSARGMSNTAMIMEYMAAKEVRKDAPETALEMLHNVWTTLHLAKRQTWLPLADEVGYQLYQTAREIGDVPTQLKALLELLGRSFMFRKDIDYDLMSLLSSSDTEPTDRQLLTVDYSSIVSSITVAVCFESAEAYAGEKVRLQLVLSSEAHPNTPSVKISSAMIKLEGLASIDLTHQDADPSCLMQVVNVAEDETESSSGTADLTLAPGQTRVLVLSTHVRETGKIAATKASIHLEGSAYKLSIERNLRLTDERYHWYSVRRGSELTRQRKRWDAGSVEVLPKLPKLKIRLPALRPFYYANEKALIAVEVVNEEPEEIEADFEAWVGDTTNENTTMSLELDDAKSIQSTHAGGVKRELGKLAVNAISTVTIAVEFPASASDETKLEVDVRYQIKNDARTVSKTMSTKIKVIEPFSAAFSVTPLLHSAPWPSFFDSSSSGLILRWRLQATLTFQGAGEFVVRDTNLQIGACSDGSTCVATASEPTSESLSNLFSHTFVLDVQRRSLDDQRPSVIETTLQLTWRPINGTEDIHTTILPPRLNLPTSEPRALATVDYLENESIKLTLTLENPSMHYLSFQTIVDPTDDYILSGPTQSSRNLVPMSRSQVDVLLLPSTDEQVLRPIVKVADTYFNKLLRVHPGEGLIADETGALSIPIKRAAQA